MSEKAVKVAFSPDKLVEAKKDFRGTIIDAEYALEPFGFKGSADIVVRRPQMAIKIRTDEYDKDQLEWYPPSDKKLTKPVESACTFAFSQLRCAQPTPVSRFAGVKWAYLIEAMASTGALRDVVVKGETDEERMQSFTKSLIGMDMRFVEKVGLESIAKGRKLELILPAEYYGKKDISPVTEVREETVEL